MFFSNFFLLMLNCTIALSTKQTESGLPSAEEAYNFFTFNFEPGPEEDQPKVETKNEAREQKDGGGEEEEEEEDEEEREGEQEGQEDATERVKHVTFI